MQNYLILSNIIDLQYQNHMIKANRQILQLKVWVPQYMVIISH